MNFEDHFRKQDLPMAKIAFNDLVSGIKLVKTHGNVLEDDALEMLSQRITNALAELNRLTCKKDESNQMYLHHLLTQSQGWFPV